MTTLTAAVPDLLYQQIQRLAEKEAVSLDQLITMALTAHLSAWEAKQYLDQRAGRGDWAKFQAILAKVPDIEPEEEDRL